MHVQGLFSSSAARPYTRVLNRAQRATPDLCFHLLPPGSTMAAAWGSGITGSGLSSLFPLLQSTQPQSGRAEIFEANTNPYRIPPLLSSHIHLPPHSTNTGVFRHHHLTVICLCRPPREGAVGRGPGPSPIVNYGYHYWSQPILIHHISIHFS